MIREKENYDINELISYINALHPIIYIKSNDIIYSRNLIKKSFDKVFKSDSNEFILDTLEVSNNIDSITPNQNFNNILDYELCSYTSHSEKRPKVLIFYDINDEINDKKAILNLKSISEKSIKTENFFFYVFIISSNIIIPDELKQYFSIFEPSNLSNNDIKDIIKEYENSIDLIDQGLYELISHLKGLSEIEVYRILNLCYQKQGYLDSESIKFVSKQKKQIIKKSNLLELVEVDKDINWNSSVGGLKILKNWIEKKKNILDDLDNASKYFGVRAPKGILLVGIPGGGKSLVAKATANYFGYPLLKMEMNRILGKFVGESEQNFQKALELAESVSPCILWIDEIEKAISTSNGDSSGVINRIFGQFLTWMQEKKSNVFIIATANNIENLPQEFLRKGRFDSIFYIDFPKASEIKEIMKIHIKGKLKFLRKPNKSNLLDKAISNKIDSSIENSLINNKNLSGADIEYLVNESLENLYQAKIDSEDIEYISNKFINILSEKISTSTPKKFDSTNFDDIKNKCKNRGAIDASN